MYKKAMVDHFIELVIVLAIIAGIVILVFNESKATEQIILEEIEEVTKKSYANSVLKDYLEEQISPCLLNSLSNNIYAGSLLQKGNLTYADLITLIMEGNPKDKISLTFFRYNDLNKEEDGPFEKGAPYGNYALIWNLCTKEHFENNYGTFYAIEIRFDNDRKSIASDLYINLPRKIAGQVMMPNYNNRKDTLKILIYEMDRSMYVQ